MPEYKVITRRRTRVFYVLVAILTSYVSFYLLLNLAWAIGFDFDYFPPFPIRPMDPIMSFIYYGQRTNFLLSFFLFDCPVFAVSIYAWWVGAFHGRDIELETPEEERSR